LRDQVGPAILDDGQQVIERLFEAVV